MTLKFPPYEWLKALPLKGKFEYRDRITGKPFYDDVHKEYTFKLFDTPTSVYGRLTYNEDNQHMIIFDVMEDGYCDHNHLGKALKFNKKNYQAICKHAQEVYDDFMRTLMMDWSWQWERDPESYEDEIVY